MTYRNPSCSHSIHPRCLCSPAVALWTRRCGRDSRAWSPAAPPSGWFHVYPDARALRGSTHREVGLLGWGTRCREPLLWLQSPRVTWRPLSVLASLWKGGGSFAVPPAPPPPTAMLLLCPDWLTTQGRRESSRRRRETPCGRSPASFPQRG